VPIEGLKDQKQFHGARGALHLCIAVLLNGGPSGDAVVRSLIVSGRRPLGRNRLKPGLSMHHLGRTDRHHIRFSCFEPR
jgi:hypothetical protein